MKISNKGELKALIKECLIEILSEGLTTRQAPRRMQSEARSSLRSITNEPLPSAIPSSMASLFADSRQRIAEKHFNESMQAEKQYQALEDMATTFENMAFNGSPLPQRAAGPFAHGIAPPPPPGMPGTPISNHQYGEDRDPYDDGFDPYEAVRSSIPKRR